MVLAFSTLLVQGAGAEAGRFLSVVGDVQVVGTDGASRTVRRGEEVDSGETVITGSQGFAQLTMSDGSRLQVRADTELKLDDYEFEGGESTTGRMFMSLLRGTMRSITGLIGSRRKENYGVRTAHATIGIRGTDHQVTVLLKPQGGFQPGTFDLVFAGKTFMKNDAGVIEIAPQQAGYVGSRAVVPRVIPVPAFLKPAAARAAPTRQGAAVERKAAGKGDDSKADSRAGAKAGARSSAAPSREALQTAPGKVGATPTLRTPLSTGSSRTPATATTPLQRTMPSLESGRPATTPLDTRSAPAAIQKQPTLSPGRTLTTPSLPSAVTPRTSTTPSLPGAITPRTSVTPSLPGAVTPRTSVTPSTSTTPRTISPPNQALQPNTNSKSLNPNTNIRR